MIFISPIKLEKDEKLKNHHFKDEMSLRFEKAHQKTSTKL